LRIKPELLSIDQLEQILGEKYGDQWWENGDYSDPLVKEWWLRVTAGQRSGNTSEVEKKKA